MMTRRFNKPSTPPAAGSDRGAALLLLNVRLIALDEVLSSPTTSSKQPPMMIDSLTTTATSEYIKSLEDDTCSLNVITPQLRCRTVSVESQDMMLMDQPSSTKKLAVLPSPLCARPSLYLSAHSRPEQPTLVEAEEESDDNTTLSSDSEHQEEHCHKRSPPLPFTPSSALVGTAVKSTDLKAVLRKKFSWKSFPELEGYLIDHREHYMQYSSQRNYTAEQKRYNNTLTQGLLDLAAAEGYGFEGFTFAMIRDRIRCYYKSYVQATKKKKRRNKAIK